MFKYLHSFDTYKDFLTTRCAADEAKINEIFEQTADTFHTMGAKKLEMPREFVRILGFYSKADAITCEYFSDIEKRYLLLSDLYDFLRLKKML
jgi:hypothetical protein